MPDMLLFWCMSGGASAIEQAVGRLVGSLCVVTGKDEDAESAMLASWVSQVYSHLALITATSAQLGCESLRTLDTSQANGTVATWM